MSKPKYKIPVSIVTTASHSIGVVECNSLEEFNQKAEELWEKLGYDSPNTNASNDFDLADWDIYQMDESELEHYKSSHG